MKNSNKSIEDCKRCKYLYITHDKFFPWGCKAFGFKSKNYPYNEVNSISGMKCALFSCKNLKDRKYKKGRFA